MITAIPWIGDADLPGHWNRVPVKRFGSVTLGKMLQSEDKGNDSLAPYMRAANVQPDGVIDVSDVKSMWFSGSELDSLTLDRGDVVVVEGGIGGYGRAAFIRDENLAGWGFQNSINRVRPFHSNDGRYLTYVLIAARRLGYIAAYCNAVSMPHLTADKLAEFPIPLPPAGEQRSIADFLDRETDQIDALISKQEQLIEYLVERRDAVIRNSIPEPGVSTWPTDKLGRWVSITNGATPRRQEVRYWDGGDFPWLTSSVVNLPEVLEASQFVTRDALRECHLPIAGPGSLLVALTGQGKTRASVTILRIRATINQHLACITPEATRWNSDYLLWSLKSSYAKLRARSDESGATRGALTVDALHRHPLVMPPLDEQSIIATQLYDQTAKIDSLMEKAQDLIALARERRAALITDAVTGKIDVSTGKVREGA
ncbi:restriction endonuclease subunit S [Saccharopolyspora sp. NPDC002686]|uniref:restriction endonuclease subunit S n=1 Tax=Saccharopolyspora sp. NPDC002686 TaxID=3154541 RepID=UPI0033345FBE